MYITGEELAKMSPSELQYKIRTNNVFARVMPEQKLLIVNALKANGEIVAMTGDGVNDAPALKAAQIGIAMGKRGTDVAREAAELVLLNDDFSAVVAAVRTGRRIYDNLKRAMGYLLSVHVPIAGMSLLPLLFNFPPVLFPAHIAFMEFIIDPACSVVFEAESEDIDIMQRPPRKLTERMFGARTIVINFLQGAMILIAIFTLYYLVVKTGRSEMVARSYAFSALVLSNLLLIVVNLSWRKNIFQILSLRNWTLGWVVGGTVLCLLSTLYVPTIAELFHLAPLNLGDLAIIAGTSIASVLWFDVAKYTPFFKNLDIVW
jgi:Ca2+-transporting ATPase